MASASWVSSDGIRVRVGAQGTLGQLKTSLVSEPALPEAEIVQLVLTGGAEATPEMQFEDSSSRLRPRLEPTPWRASSTTRSPASHRTCRRASTRPSPLNPQPEFELQTSERVSVRVTTSLGETREGTDRSDDRHRLPRRIELADQRQMGRHG